MMEKLAALRGKFMYFHGNNFYPQPNQWAAFMIVLVDCYCVLIIVAYPFRMFSPLDVTRIPGFCPLVIVSVFLLTFSFWGTMSMTRALADPFSSHIDTFNIDALIA